MLMKDGLTIQNDGMIDELVIFERVSEIIESRKSRAAAYANSEITLMYWEVGRYINSVVLDFKRAEYDKQIFATLSRNLVEAYGNSFEVKNLYRMTQFANTFTDFASLEKWAYVLSWSHFLRRSYWSLGRDSPLLNGRSA
jgi:hypothetical protein